MKNDLIERYVYAVTKNLPSKVRSDIESELYTIIEDMLESRSGEITPSDNDIRVVLTELGTPSELAEKYSPDSDKFLIGPQYYSKYKFLLYTVLFATAFGLFVAGIITTIMDPEAVWYLAVPSWLGMTIMGLLNAFAFVTLLFAIFQRKGIAINIGNDSLDNLPPVPIKNQIISKYESIIGITISVIFGVVFLIAPEILSVALVDGESTVSIFNTQIIKSIWYIIIGFAVLGIIRECFKLYEGRYTKRLAVVTIITDVLSALLSLLFLLDNKIINTEFTKVIISLFQEEGNLTVNILSQINIFFLCLILFALALDMINTIARALKYDK